MDRGWTLTAALRKRPLAFVLSCALAACSVDTKPAGGLVVAVESDLSLPKDFDRFTFDVSAGGSSLQHSDVTVGEGQQLLPAEFSVPPTSDGMPVQIRIVAYLGNQPKIERSAIAQVPMSRRALLRLSLDYLCEKTANQDGTSTCGDDQTCRDGACASAAVTESDLLDFGSPAAQAAARGTSYGGDAKCFDTLACFGEATQVEVGSSCTFSLPADAASSGQNVNIALQLSLGSDGICGQGYCWVPLDFGGDGWSRNGSQVTLPASVCAGNAASFKIAYSTSCMPKTLSTPPCGSWSSITEPVESPGQGTTTPGNPGETGPSVGNACEGESSESCGNCGTRKRTCQKGVWSDWSDCSGGGVCAIETAQPCGAGGTQICDSMCKWGECLGQVCSGPPLQSCGKCGTQRRTCDAATAKWSDWGPCSDEGVCEPGETQACGTNGTRACGGSCQWGACGDQACPGAPSMPCGNCGSATRTCNPNDATWTSYSACTMEGACAPNSTKACGNGGTQTCTGSCQWDPACSGQMCQGAATQACGNCGAQTRTCDTNTGKWSDWSACSNSGVCAPGQSQTCGAGGSQTCGDNCQWNSACTGQSCSGAMTQSCGNCGTQSRTCDANSGKWSGWSSCSDQGSCTPGSSQTCGAGGKQSCSNSCEWGACTGQTCSGSATQGCGNCGTQSRTCNGGTGQWSNWGACMNEGSCAPNKTQSCGTGGTQTCNNSCQFGDCTGQTCGAGPTTQACGNCGSQSRTCDTTSGKWGNWSACSNEGVCAPNKTEACGNKGTATCGASCQWGACSGQTCDGPSMQACGKCGMQSRSCNSNTGQYGAWSACMNEGVCTGTDTQMCGSGGTQTCNASTCQYGACTGQTCGTGPTTQACGNCGMQMRTCNTNTGQFNAWSACMNQGQCNPNDTQKCGANNSGTQTCNTSCAWGTCSGVSISCTGASSQACGNCGTQTRTCDMSSGMWSAWGTCTNQGQCGGNDTQKCGANNSGTQTCNAATCMWNACTGVNIPCTGASSQTCGNCGTQTRTCDTTTGNWGNFGACTNQGVCSGTQTQMCGSNNSGTQTCVAATCQWGTCTGVNIPCTGSATQACGNCGTQVRVCDTSTGNWGSFSACGGEGTCKPGSTTSCDGGAGTQTCSDACKLSACVCPKNLSDCSGACVDMNTDPDNCGKCGGVCAGTSTCVAGLCTAPPAAGSGGGVTPIGGAGASGTSSPGGGGAGTTMGSAGTSSGAAGMLSGAAGMLSGSAGMSNGAAGRSSGGSGRTGSGGSVGTMPPVSGVGGDGTSAAGSGTLGDASSSLPLEL